MAATPRLPKYAALCVRHRKVVGSNDQEAVWRRWQLHARLYRCTAAEVRPAKEIPAKIVEQGLVECLCCSEAGCHAKETGPQQCGRCEGSGWAHGVREMRPSCFWAQAEA